MDVVGYDVLQETILNILINNINEKIKSGWKPIGGITIGKSTDEWSNNSYYQAIVKEK